MHRDGSNLGNRATEEPADAFETRADVVQPGNDLAGQDDRGIRSEIAHRFVELALLDQGDMVEDGLLWSTVLEPAGAVPTSASVGAAGSDDETESRDRDGTEDEKC
jgi:hypothetical protein